MNALQHLAGFFQFHHEAPMIFTQLDFWGFLLVVLLGLWGLRKQIRVRNAFLLLASLFFYYKSCGWFFLLIIVSSLLNFWLARAMARQAGHAARKALLALALTLNLALLAYFKYAGFFSESFLQLKLFLGLAAPRPVPTPAGFSLWKVVLPVGISFYTFQAISYVVDVYRQQLQPLRRTADFALYLAFFPSLVAGPIVRATEFLPQLFVPYQVSQRERGHALFLILTGLLKKIILADYVALNLVDRVFANPTAYSGVENLLAMYGYALQIYCDFSGYTDVAIGVALLLGFRLSANFNLPYRSVRLTEFWRRWHISLSTWLRDYLYIPLGGSWHGWWVMAGALMATMVLGGLWHGANWTFVFWGTMHGVGLILSKAIDKMIPAWKKYRILVALRALLTFHVVCILWVFFRAQTFGQATDVLQQICMAFRPQHLVQAFQGYRNVVLLMVLGYTLHWLPVRWLERTRGLFIGMPTWSKMAVALLVTALLLAVQGAALQPFIYFDF